MTQIINSNMSTSTTKYHKANTFYEFKSAFHIYKHNNSIQMGKDAFYFFFSFLFFFFFFFSFQVKIAEKV